MRVFLEAFFAAGAVLAGLMFLMAAPYLLSWWLNKLDDWIG